MTLKSRFIAVVVGLRSVAADVIPPNPFALIVTALAFVMVGGVCAFAQDGSAPIAAASFGDTFAKISNFAESFFILVGCVFALLTGAPLANGVINILGIKDATQRAQLEKLFSDRLHNAVGRSIQYAVAKSGLPISAITITTILSDAVAYLQDKNPDDIAFFKLEVKQVEDLVTANWPNVFSWLKGNDAPGVGTSGSQQGPDLGSNPSAALTDAAYQGGLSGARQALRAYDAALSDRVRDISRSIDTHTKPPR